MLRPGKPSGKEVGVVAVVEQWRRGDCSSCMPPAEDLNLPEGAESGREGATADIELEGTENEVRHKETGRRFNRLGRV